MNFNYQTGPSDSNIKTSCRATMAGYLSGKGLRDIIENWNGYIDC